MHPLLQSVLPTSHFSVALPSLGIIQINGNDATKFLQGQITQDVLTMQLGESRLAACCNAQGRMRAIFRISLHNDGFLLVMPRLVVPSFIDTMKKYAAFFKVQLNDVSEQWQITGHYAADESAKVPTNSITIDVGSHRTLTLTPGQPESNSNDETRWFALDIIQQLAWVWPETVETLLPHEVGLKEGGGVSFNKGCYTGQEIVARMEYRGKLKNAIVVAFCAMTDHVAAGTEVFSGENSGGTVIGSARHPIAGQLLLVNLKNGQNTDALTLNLPSRPILQVLTI